mmetsp:Transcript_36585/g.53733  ORF Transcript_36585/g.53733 Transcript_36585/m.53733 type:complete len:550 (-) Transcript_36585:186-1835(-)
MGFDITRRIILATTGWSCISLSSSFSFHPRIGVKQYGRITSDLSKNCDGRKININSFLLEAKERNHNWNLYADISEKNGQTETATADRTEENSSSRKAGAEKTPTRTLYDVLGSTPNATRAELKRSYVAMARISHPDALVAKSLSMEISNSTDMNQEELQPDFAEIASAWKILADPRERQRYDRSLQAEILKKDIARAASSVGKAAAPRAIDLFEKVAIPMIRRTTVTASSAFSAAAEDLSSASKVDGDLGSIFSSAVQAGWSAGRVVDKIELMEKSAELDARAAEEFEEMQELKKKLNLVAKKRLEIALQTPNSAISTKEAWAIFDTLNTTTSRSIIGNLMSKRSIHILQGNIEVLDEVETKYNKELKKKNVLKGELKRKEKSLEKAGAYLKAAAQAEKRANEALVRAQKLLRSSQQEEKEATEIFNETKEKLQQLELDNATMKQSLLKQQEKVRSLLKRKQKAFANQDKNNAESSVDGLPVSTTVGTSNRESMIKMKREEDRLRYELKKVGDRMDRLKSRSDKLKEEAGEVQREEAEGNSGISPQIG